MTSGRSFFITANEPLTRACFNKTLIPYKLFARNIFSTEKLVQLIKSDSLTIKKYSYLQAKRGIKPAPSLQKVNKNVG